MMKATVHGIPDLKLALAQIAPKLQYRALRNALAASARVVRDEAKRLTPVLQVPVRTKGGVVKREPGTVRKALSVRTSKNNKRAGNVGVFVNVRPAKRGSRGTNNPRDPFYWRWLEFGARHMPGRSFLQGAASKLPESLEVFKAKIGPQIAKLNKKGAIL